MGDLFPMEDLFEKIINMGENIGYLNALKELLRQGYDIDDIKEICTRKYGSKVPNNIIYIKLTEECEKKHLIKKSRSKVNF